MLWRRTPLGRVWPTVAFRFWRRLPKLARWMDERDERRRVHREAADAARVTLADLAGARHSLSVPRFYPQAMLTVDEFRHSDPLDEVYAGKLEAEFRRVRNEDEAVAE